MEDIETRLRRQLGRALEIAGKHKDRELRIVRGLGAIQQALGRDDLRKASLALDSLLQTDLKDARHDAYQRDVALRLAVQVLQRHDKTKDIADALKEIETLAPDAFETPEVGAGTATA
jgi:hypothetical protein